MHNEFLKIKALIFSTFCCRVIALGWNRTYQVCNAVAGATIEYEIGAKTSYYCMLRIRWSHAVKTCWCRETFSGQIFIGIKSWQKGQKLYYEIFAHDSEFGSSFLILWFPPAKAKVFYFSLKNSFCMYDRKLWANKTRAH